MNNKFEVIIIGGGASGLICAGFAAGRGKKTAVIERNSVFGKKLSITGKGRCNITNLSTVDTLIENIASNPSFLYSAFYTFPPESLLEFFLQNNLQTVTERGNRVFPKSGKAADVVNALETFALKNGVVPIKNTFVSKIITEEKNGLKQTVGVVTEKGQKIYSNSVVLACGGMSYPKTGSDGSGFKLAENCGHTIVKPFPSLVALLSKDGFIPKLQGLSLKNVSIKACENDKQIYSGFGEMLFTHNGVSGPLILTAGRHLTKTAFRGAKIIVDLKPALKENELDDRILRDFSKHINKDYINALSELLPQKLIPVVCEISDIDERKKVRDITKQERLRLLQTIKRFTVTVYGTAGFNEAVVTAGGVSVTEVNPGSMESKLIKGLYFCGEILDIDGYTGGFNLQAAFSTGYLAGNSV